MRHKLIDWVDAQCHSWGYSMRRIYVKDQKWPESVWARICDGIPPSDFRDQKFLEVHQGDALTMARLMHMLNERQYTGLYVHYVIPGSLKSKLWRLNKSSGAHYEMVAWVHKKFANAVEHGYPNREVTYPDKMRVVALRA